MNAPTYITSCPRCGQQLTPHAGDPFSTPWLCNNCTPRVGFWVCELQPGYRAHYRPQHMDFGHGLHNQQLHIERLQEIHEAVKRGTSAREDQLPLLSQAELEHVMKRKVAPGFLAQVDQEHARRGVR